jgi:membrane associated rhomboid family serine protease
MQHTAITERELAHNLVRKLPWLTLSITALAFILTTLIETNAQEVAFSLQLRTDSFAGKLAFDSSAPLRLFGLTVLSSFFAHTDWNHFFSNAVWLVLIGSALELRKKRIQLLLALAGGHLIALLGGYVQARAFAGMPILLGMSGGVCFGALMWLGETQSGYRSATVSLILFALCAFQPFGFFITHAIPAGAGFMFGLLLKQRTSIQNDRKSATLPLASATKKSSSNTATGA